MRSHKHYILPCLTFTIACSEGSSASEGTSLFGGNNSDPGYATEFDADGSPTGTTNDGADPSGTTSASGATGGEPTTAGTDGATTTGTTGTTGTTDAAGTTDAGGAPGGVCGADPCFGDVVGKWTYDSFLCDDIVWTPHHSCKGGMESMTLWTEGTLEFTGDGTSIVHRREVQTFRIVMPKTCIFGTCDGVFEGEWKCEDDGVNCDCKAEFYGQWVDAVAPYTVEGHTIHSGEDTIDFCVSTDGLALIHLDLAKWTYLAPGE